MSNFWSGWVVFFVVLNLALVVFLFIFALRVRIPVDKDGSTGHIWAHGVLREGLHRLPRWWVLLSIVVLAVSFVYLLLYPGFGGYQGALGWSSVERVERSQAEHRRQLVDIKEFVRDQPLSVLAGDPGVQRAAAVLYDDNCAACHGPDGRGNPLVGAPDLTNASWSWGGSEAAIRASIAQGRRGAMPGFGGALGDDGVQEVTAYLRSLDGAQGLQQERVRRGAERYQQLCVACHGPEGKGNTALGAPDLTDGYWIWGGDVDAIAHSVRYGRQGVMPGWSDRLDAEEIELLLAWIHARGQAAP